MRYIIHLNYNGKNYHGWQIQPDSDSVQARLEEVLTTMLRVPTAIMGCGRTDSGVHARCYYAHFDAPTNLPDNFVIRMNKMLPVDIGVFDISPIKDDGHARFDATSREYRYFVHFKKDAFLQDRSYWLFSYDIDIEKMNVAASRMMLYNDFRTFEKKGGGNKTSICKVTFAEWQQLNENQLVFVIKADRFLRNMVRRITGALLSVGIGQMTIDEMEIALKNKLPLEVKFAPPAHGLFLWNIDYPDTFLN
ncbi:MAG: tRNA pseudouridine(38-40) synthase TruA [Bacteroidetes bacterium]|nr:tRNA pseudouridine(38-40) synthase TruA [Bacteroidota bacterium]